MDRRQPRVACSGAVASLGFEMVEEGADQLGVEVVDLELAHRRRRGRRPADARALDVPRPRPARIDLLVLAVDARAHGRLSDLLRELVPSIRLRLGPVDRSDAPPPRLSGRPRNRPTQPALRPDHASDGRRPSADSSSHSVAAPPVACTFRSARAARASPVRGRGRRGPRGAPAASRTGRVGELHVIHVCSQHTPTG